MCFFERTQFQCGSWKWGRFREQYDKEYRTGETCGLKLVFCTQYAIGAYGPCRNIAKKQRRVEKMTADIERWRGEGNRPATIERTEYDLDIIRRSISDLQKQHLKGEEFGGSRRQRKSG